MGVDLAQLLSAPVYRAFDIDEAGRILAGSDESGSTQLVEISPDGNAAADRAARRLRRPLPARRADRDRRPTTTAATSAPAVAARACRSPAAAGRRWPTWSRWSATRATSTCWPTSGRAGSATSTNRRDGVDFDPVIRDLATGAERTLALGDALLGEAALSPDGRWLALTVSSQVTANAEPRRCSSTWPPTRARSSVTAVTAAGRAAMNGPLHWSPDGARAALHLEQRPRVHRRRPLRAGQRAADLAVTERRRPT